MEIELALSRQRAWPWVWAMALLGFVGLGLLGQTATPVESGEVVLLTPDRWQAHALARQAQAETAVLQTDVTALQELLDQAAPDPVAAMLLAQGVYARHRSGTSATATARQAAIHAAETVARYAAGSASEAEAIDALNQALLRLALLVHSADRDQLRADPGAVAE